MALPEEITEQFRITLLMAPIDDRGEMWGEMRKSLRHRISSTWPAKVVIGFGRHLRSIVRMEAATWEGPEFWGLRL